MSGNGRDNRTHQIRSIMRMRIATYLLAIEYMGYMRLLQSIKGILQDPDGRVGTAEDNDSDPATSAEESFDLAFISTPEGIVVVDVTTPNAPRKIDLIPIPSGVVKVDREKRLAYTTGMSIISLKALSLNTPPTEMGLRDADGDNINFRRLRVKPLLNT